MACTSMVLIFLTLQFPVDFLVLFDPISIILTLSMVFFEGETNRKRSIEVKCAWKCAKVTVNTSLT